MFKQFKEKIQDQLNTDLNGNMLNLVLLGTVIIWFILALYIIATKSNLAKAGAISWLLLP